MAMIQLTDGNFSVIPEGVHVFKITAVTYKEAFGKLEVTMKTKEGAQHIERFSLKKSNGENNDGALNAFSYFAKVALNDFSRSAIDHEELVGHYMECVVEHDVQENKNKPGQTITFVRLAEKNPSDGWEEAPVETLKTVGQKTKLDLKSLLG